MYKRKGLKRTTPFLKGLKRTIGRSKGMKHLHSLSKSGLRPIQREAIRAVKRQRVGRGLGN